MLIADLIINYAQKKTEHVEYYPVSHNDSEIHAEQNGNLKRHEISKIEGRVQCRRCLRYSRPGETFLRLWTYVASTTDEIKKQADQRISSRFIMYVLHDFAMEKKPKGPALW